MCICTRQRAASAPLEAGRLTRPNRRMMMCSNFLFCQSHSRLSDSTRFIFASADRKINNCSSLSTKHVRHFELLITQRKRARLQTGNGAAATTVVQVSGLGWVRLGCELQQQRSEDRRKRLGWLDLIYSYTLDISFLNKQVLKKTGTSARRPVPEPKTSL